MNIAAIYSVSLARRNGRGSAGQCPAFRCAITPAAQKQVCHVVAVEQCLDETSPCVTAHAATGEGVE